MPQQALARPHRLQNGRLQAGRRQVLHRLAVGPDAGQDQFVRPRTRSGSLTTSAAKPTRARPFWMLHMFAHPGIDNYNSAAFRHLQNPLAGTHAGYTASSSAASRFARPALKMASMQWWAFRPASSGMCRVSPAWLTSARKIYSTKPVSNSPTRLSHEFPRRKPGMAARSNQPPPSPAHRPSG